MSDQRKINITIVCGTRPEIIKLAPLFLLLQQASSFQTRFVITGQHADLAQQMVEVFGITPHVTLERTKITPSLNDTLGETLQLLQEEFIAHRPEMVIVQGDTTSALAGALAAFHLEIPVAHVEAGLRTDDVTSPFPEEMNRVLISKLAELHFAPTARAYKRLEEEKVRGSVCLTGNTAIDALLWVEKKLAEKSLEPEPLVTKFLQSETPFLLATFHRRENHGQGASNFSKLLLSLCKSSGYRVVLPLHPNPAVKEALTASLANQEQITLLPPLPYPSLVSLMKSSAGILSDSGGIQEEAPSFGKYVFVTRSVTERSELLELGLGELLDLDDPLQSAERVKARLLEPALQKPNPFGDGRASERIVKGIKNHFDLR